MEARYYEKLENDRVRCLLCPQTCTIKPGRTGICRIRKNVDGLLIADGYGQVTSMAIDPIEKKPLYHFHPGKPILSIGNNGCNLRCLFCQNCEISQFTAPTREVSPEELVEIASRRGSIGIAFTYAEPMIWIEYVCDCGKLAREKGLKNVLVTNGMINPEPLKELIDVIDAMNIDLKSMNPDFYRRLCGGYRDPVLVTIQTVHAAGIHIELANLLVTGENDSDEDIANLTDWVADLDPEIPVHFSRYFPYYKYDNPPTPMERLEAAYHIARRKLKWIYVGNIPHVEFNSTVCPTCGNVLIRRNRYTVDLPGIEQRRCSVCAAELPIIGL